MTQREKRRAAAERVVVIAALALSTAAGLPGITQSTQTADTQTVEPTPQWAWYVLYGLIVVLCLRHSEELLRVATRSRLLLAVVGWALLSVSWSDATSLTFRRSVALALTTLLGLFIAARYDRDEIFDLVSWVLAAVLVASVAVAVLRPAYGLDHLRGDAWRGLFDTKNELGRIAALTAVVWLLRTLVRPRSVVSWGILVTEFVVIDRSQSRTSLVVILALGALIAALPALRAREELVVASCCFLTIVLGSITYWLLEHPGRAVGAVNASMTMTGRTEIWTAVWTMIERHVWFGYGYSGFWRGLDGPSAFVWGSVGSTPPHSHNGFLDTWLDLGALGLTLVALSLVTTLVFAWPAMRRAESVVQTWPLVFVVFLLLFNLTESALVVRNSLFWVVYVAAAASLAAERAHLRSSAARPSRDRSSLLGVPEPA
jgi:exopolysaccharide production protein ExoQ